MEVVKDGKEGTSTPVGLRPGLRERARENDGLNGHEEVTGQIHVEVYDLMCRTDHEAKFYGLFASISAMVWVYRTDSGET